MQEFINQYGKTVVTYTLFAILIAILIGGSVFGLKGLLYVQGEKADEAAYIEEYQTDEDGKIKMDENGNKIKQNNDVKYITDTNGQTIAIADTDDFADNLDSALNKYSNLSINTKTSSFADSNSLSFGEENSIFNGTIDINNRRYNIGKEEDIWHRFMHRKQMKFRNMRQSMRMKYVIWPGNVWSFWRMTVYYHFQIR